MMFALYFYRDTRSLRMIVGVSNALSEYNCCRTSRNFINKKLFLVSPDIYALKFPLMLNFMKALVTHSVLHRDSNTFSFETIIQTYEYVKFLYELKLAFLFHCLTSNR